MARPLRMPYPGAFFHGTSRGSERKAVFTGAGDPATFLEYLATAGQRYDAVVHAYCLMDHHYHLLLQAPATNLPPIMRHIDGPIPPILISSAPGTVICSKVEPDRLRLSPQAREAWGDVLGYGDVNDNRMS